ncbi:MAG: 16S rRNA (guanine(966)-N(2))-methyltransferase RsmD [candidate division KSB1 bacterium]|nr:16S rRNA (guanine(966)-N(2))-methyltransferase RsmD [candidate division KSB1 bacterium]
MRIIAGTLKNFRLISPHGQSIRPTSDRVREWIFSCLIRQIKNARVLDLFSGTGAFGLEAQSRGARSVTFVDQATQAVDLTRENIDKAGVSADIFRDDAVSFLSRTDKCFDIIFLDPPYQFDQLEKLTAVIDERHLLAKDGVLIYETDRHERPIEPDAFSQNTRTNTKSNKGGVLSK